MIKANELKGRSIVATTNGEEVGKVTDVLFDYQGNRMVALLTDKGGWLTDAKLVELAQVRSLGADAIMVDDSQAITSVNAEGRLKELLTNRVDLRDKRLLTRDGRDLGKIADIYFDEETGCVEGYEVTGGLFADLTSGRTFVPTPEEIALGKDNAMVAPEVALAMQEAESGGLKRVLQSASERMKSVYDEDSDATAERQREYVVGKKAGSDVILEDGTRLVAEGEEITAEHAELGAKEGKLLALVAAAARGSVADAHTRA